MSISPRSAAPGPALTANWLLLGFCLAAWWLASPYLGLAHDAQYYAAEAMRRSGDFDALNRDLFFARGTQGEFSIFPLPYAALTRAIGIQAAALSSTTLVRILWLIALAGLCAVALPRRRALAGLCALLVLPSSYGVMHILAYGEPFATPRHWAEATRPR